MTDPYEFETALDGADALSGWTADELLDLDFESHAVPMRVYTPTAPSPLILPGTPEAAQLVLALEPGSPWHQAALAAVASGAEPADPAYEAISLDLAELVRVRQSTPQTLDDSVLTVAKAMAEPPQPPTYVVDQILPVTSMALMVGRSGLGKSPLLVQLGMAVALGKPFLGLATRQTPVLFIDAESIEEHARSYLRDIAGVLGADTGSSIPFYFHSVHFSPYAAPEHTIEQRTEVLMKKFKPGLVIFDCLRPLWPDAEKDNTNAQSFWRFQKHLVNTYGCSTLTVHHLRKPPTDPKTGATMGVRIQDDVRDWLNQAAGSSALITQAQSRLGVDFETNREENTLVLGGFTKARVSMSPLVIDRVFDDDGMAVGYTVNKQSAWDKLGEDLKMMYAALPPTFRHKDVVTQFPAQSKTSITRLLDKLKTAGKLKQGKDKVYVKVG